MLLLTKTSELPLPLSTVIGVLPPIAAEVSPLPASEQQRGRCLAVDCKVTPGVVSMTPWAPPGTVAFPQATVGTYATLKRSPPSRTLAAPNHSFERW